MVECNPYPVCYGVEEEARFRVLTKSELGTYSRGVEVSEYRTAFKRQDALHPEVVVQEGYDSTGSRRYIDGTGEPEIATAECPTISELQIRMRGTEDRFTELAQCLATPLSTTQKVILNRRVLDTRGNSIGYHINFGFTGEPLSGKGRVEQFEDKIRVMLIGHLATRSMVVGAGHCDAYGKMWFSQKIQDLTGETGHTNENTLYTVRQGRDNPRVEVRNNDIHISDWAARMDVGSTAIALSIANAGLTAGFDTIPIDDLIDIQAATTRFNQMPIKADGTFGKSADLQEAVAFQKKMAETFLSDEMRQIAEQPEELMQVARELLKYCSDMEKVLNGEASYTILADRADWAAKTKIILDNIAQDQAAGKTRRLGDRKSTFDDLRYDCIVASKNKEGKAVAVKAGSGYRLRDKEGVFKDTVPQEAVRKGNYSAPGTTRATLRAQIVRDYEVRTISWDELEVVSTDPGHPIFIHFRDARQTKLAQDKMALLQQYGVRRPRVDTRSPA